MQSTKTRITIKQLGLEKSLLISGILLALVGLVLAAYHALPTTLARSKSEVRQVISQQALAEQYGVEVNLVAVTAAGGMVDLRLGLTDGEKAKSLLGDQANFPALLIGDGTVLQASEDITSQMIKFESGNHIFVFYPNSHNAVKPGGSVTVLFGDLQLEPIQVK